MSDPTKNRNVDGINEWTIMFFFASDNELAPLIVSQLKGIKDAGYQEAAEVVVHFDPKEEGAPTRVYNVNSARKKARKDGKTHIGDSDTYIRNLLEDDIKPSATGRLAAQAQAASNSASSAEDALSEFLRYCANNHRASHYMLFLVGHGMIVGNDAFLSDDQPVSAITLESLGTILRDFAEYAGGVLELLALHSCSMSGIEVAYQLKGTARYMMASEGLSFVGSWPYRQMVMRTFKAIDNNEMLSSDDIGILIEKLYGLAFYNARDFWLSGYSMDLSLCSLDPTKFDDLTKKLKQLVLNLKEGLYDERAKELILLAHLKSQSYWGESYTDIYDFCQCLFDACASTGVQGEIKTACKDVMTKLDPVDSEDALERLKALVIHSRNYGWKYQYSHGLSIYFPWAEPIEDKKILTRYENYAFTAATGKQLSWLSFLNAYFTETRRNGEKGRVAQTSIADPITDIPPAQAAIAADEGFGNGVAADFSNGLSGPGLSGALPGNEGKVSGSTGAACTCPSIKNYPIEQL